MKKLDRPNYLETSSERGVQASALLYVGDCILELAAVIERSLERGKRKKGES